MADLVEFLKARLAEDEQVVHRSLDAPPDALRYVDADEWSEGLVWLANEERMLREVEAKRRILADHTTPHTVVDGFCVEEGGDCTHAGEAECSWHGTDDCSTVRDLAAPYSDHPDYDPAWAVTRERA